MAEKKDQATALYQLKITLSDSQPPIWRKLCVKDTTRLDELHHIFQVAMGWENCHLHEYRVDGDFIGPEDPEFDLENIDERTIPLNEIVSKPKDEFFYDYDFGDGWEHVVVLEKIHPLGFLESPLVVAGVMACPPEDCGGLGGYYELLDILVNPNHANHEMMLDWLGEGFDPVEFDIDLVNEELKNLKLELEEGEEEGR